jgi:cellulose synthase/poly-beta-1,6-N-acetylglucosamine synthase-like glycosyltransferase
MIEAGPGALASDAEASGARSGARPDTTSEERRRALADLDLALAAASPRLAPPPTPWRSIAIHAAVAALWLALFARAFGTDTVFAWSAGFLYIFYDTALIAFVFAQTLSLARKPAGEAAPGCRRLTLGVVVAAHNEERGLPGALGALLDQGEPADMVIIADDGSTDGTAAILARDFGFSSPAHGALSGPSADYPALRWLRLPHGGKARALNAALVAIETDLVMTVDGDTLLAPGAIGAMRAAFAADPALVAATGVLTPVCDRSLGGRLFQWFQTYEYIRNFLSRYAWARLDSLLLISGAFACFRRAPVLIVGGFDPVSMVEDYELIHRLRRHGALHGLGWTTGVVGAARAITEAPGAAAAFLAQRRRWFGGFLETQYWYRDMVGDPRFGRLGLLMLPIKALDTLQPIYGLTAFALLLFYLATARFSLIAPVGGVIMAKIAVDFAFHLWSVHLYRRWVDPDAAGRPSRALLASLAEPFTFQPLRHAGALLGWISVITGNRRWKGSGPRLDGAPQRRAGKGRR